MNLLSDYIIANVSIVDVVNQYLPGYSLASGNIQCLFPDHDDSTPSMKVYPETGTVYCFGCSRGANSISLVAAKEEITEFEALEKIKEMFDLEVDLTKIDLKALSNFDHLLEDAKDFDAELKVLARHWLADGYVFAPTAIQELLDWRRTLSIEELELFNGRLKNCFYEETTLFSLSSTSPEEL